MIILRCNFEGRPQGRSPIDFVRRMWWRRNRIVRDWCGSQAHHILQPRARKATIYNRGQHRRRVAL